MEPSKEAIAVRITRLNRQILGKATNGSTKLKRTIDRESLLDALTVLYDECNDDPVKKCDDLVKAFVDKYRSTLAELRSMRVCLSDFDIIQTIGRGHFGEVHMVREKQTSDVYALKVVRKDQAGSGAGGRRAGEEEREVLAANTTPWMPRLQYAFQDATNLYLVMELCSGGDLAGLLARRNHPLSERDAAFYVAEVAHALKALHGMGYVHRDVKPGNILLDRCGHVKLGDLGSCVRLSERERGAWCAVGTADYVAPELLAAADCARRHAVCARSCRGITQTAISACDYWSLGVVAFELVTLRRPFSSPDDDSIPKILANIQKYERDESAEPPFGPTEAGGPGGAWRALVAGLLAVQPARRYNYLDTLQHAALAHLATHNVRSQAPPWVPCVRGPEDASLFSAEPRGTPPPSAAPFRARTPFAGQLPFIGFSYVAPDDHDDSTGTSGFNASHDCTAIDLATFKSAEKLAAMRGREVAALQSKLAAAEAAAGEEAERTRRAAEAEAERQRARLQAEITALSLQNRRLERQIEVEKEERMAVERSNQQLSSAASERAHADRRAQSDLAVERDALREALAQAEAERAELQAECNRARAAADSAQQQHKHYQDTIAKERALRRQTLSGGEAECREAGARAAQAEARLAQETRAREHAERRAHALEAERTAVNKELDDIRKELSASVEALGERRRVAEAAGGRLRDAHTELAHEKARTTALAAQVQELERAVAEASRREAALEEQCARTEARFHQKLEAAEARAAAALQDDQRHREKVATLEQLVRQLEREVSALEGGGGGGGRGGGERGAGGGGGGGGGGDAHSDTESGVHDAHAHAGAQAQLLREQLERAEGQLQARADEIAALRQEARTANLARWRKERECNELSVEAKSSAREVKRLEERLSAAVSARREAESKASTLQAELSALKPQHERAQAELARATEQLDKLRKEHETAQAEVDRSRNDIRKLKSELQYSERRRLHAEEQEELSSRERAQLRDELTETRASTQLLQQNNKALQEACSLLEDQLTDLEKLVDTSEIKNSTLESEVVRLRGELEACRARVMEAQRVAVEREAAASSAARREEEERDQAHHAHCQLQLLRERLENRESQVCELESRVAALESELAGVQGALAGAARRVHDLQEECSMLRTRAHDHHAHALELQAALRDSQEEVIAVREANEAATAWWRTRETKADATLRQQAKLIDFLQVKLEEANRKKCSLSHKLFGRSGRRALTSPPLRKANRELREEVDRLRAELNAQTNGDGFPTPVVARTANPSRRMMNVDTQKSPETEDEDKKLVIIWSDGSRERVKGKAVEGELVLCRADRETRARLLHADGDAGRDLPHNEADRTFTIQLEDGTTARVVCSSVCARASWVSRLVHAAPAAAPAARVYAPRRLLAPAPPVRPLAALYLAPDAIAIGCSEGLLSLRGEVSLQLDGENSAGGVVSALCAADGRAFIVYNGVLVEASTASLASALRRAGSLHPALDVTPVTPVDSDPHIVQAIATDGGGGVCVAAACGRRVVVAGAGGAGGTRAVSVGGAPRALLLAPRALYVGGTRPLRLPLPAGALETFAPDDPLVSVCARRHSPPTALLPVRADPLELLVCYAEGGVFLDERGRRTRPDEPRWTTAVRAAEYVAPFLYLVGELAVTVLHVTDDSYRAPPCTCDTASLASAGSSCAPDRVDVRLREPALLGRAPAGVLVRTAAAAADGYEVVLVEGKEAFRSIGASVESLASTGSKRSSTDSARSTYTPRRAEPGSPERAPRASPLVRDTSLDSVAADTGFLADIRARARQLRERNRRERRSDEVIKRILMEEVGPKRAPGGRKSPARTSECSSEEDASSPSPPPPPAPGPAAAARTAPADELCAEMFSRQVRFQHSRVHE